MYTAGAAEMKKTRHQSDRNDDSHQGVQIKLISHSTEPHEEDSRSRNLSAAV